MRILHMYVQVVVCVCVLTVQGMMSQLRYENISYVCACSTSCVCAYCARHADAHARMLIPSLSETTDFFVRTMI